jgi:aryl-alcohol dehydrogenase-like predicted oxidoreductase
MSSPVLDLPLARHRQLAPSAAVRVSPLCLGAMNFGDANKERLGECTKETAFEILDHFFSHGGNFIDTATGYQAGQSEMWLGEWMATRKNRDQIVLATKYSGVSRHPPEKIHLKTNFGGNGSKSMRLAIEESLRRLQTSYIDIFYVHWWDYATSIEELMHSLNDLISAGKALYLGISDTPAWVVAKANQYARSNGLRQFSVYQGMWNAALRDFERDIIPMCRDEGMGICPYGVLNQGRFQTEEGYKEREKNNPGRKHSAVSNHDKTVSEVLEGISKEKDDYTGINQVALSYVMQKAPYVFPIVGGRTVEHIKGNIAGLSVVLDDGDVEKIESAYRFDPGFPHTFLSGTLLKGHDATPKGAYNPSQVWYVKTMGEIDFVEPQKAIKASQKPTA